MAPQAERWKILFQVFDPRQRLSEVQQDLYVSRPGAVADKVRQQIPFEPTGKWIIAGSLGSGKSSELVHLGRALWDDYTIVALDLPFSVARVDRLTPTEILFLIGAAGLHRAKAEMISVPNKVKDALSSAFAGVLDPTKAGHVNASELLQGVALFVSNLAAPGNAAASGAALGAARLATGILGGATRSVREGELAVADLLGAVEEILRLIAPDGRPPLVLVDGLDKIQDRGAIRSLFGESRLLSQLAAPSVYSGPITLMLSALWKTVGDVFRCERLTNVVVRHPPASWVELDPQRVEEGRLALRHVVERRLARFSLGVEDVFASDALEEILSSSGGVLRDLVHIVNRCCPLAHDQAAGGSSTRIDRPLARQAIEELRKELEITLTGKRVAELRYVKENGEPSGDGEASDDLLLNGYVLPYANGRVWFEPHPLLSGVRPGL